MGCGYNSIKRREKMDKEYFKNGFAQMNLNLGCDGEKELFFR
jgi:hypothetical protein